MPHCLGMCVPTDEYKSTKQFTNIGVIMRLTKKQIEAIQLALMSSDYFHCESLSDQGLDAKDRKVMISAFEKFGLDISGASDE